MPKSLSLFELPVRTELATRRCDLKCDWCRYCDTRNVPSSAFEKVMETPPHNDHRLYSIIGGDPFRHADVERWVAWARQSPRARVCIEGPAASFSGSVREEVIERLLKAKPDAVSVVLPTVDAARTEALSGLRWEPAQVYEALARLREAGIALQVVFPVNEKTLTELAPAVMMTAKKLGRRVHTLLRRIPIVRAAKSLTVVRSGQDWPELDALSAALAELPLALPGGAQLRMDAHDGYAPCMLRREVRFAGLINSARAGVPKGAKPLAACENCAWSTSCTWSAPNGQPPPDQVNPLTFDEAVEIQEQRAEPTHTPRPARTREGYEAVGLRSLLCAAPWTTLSMTDPRHNPVPCAFSWVKTSMSPEESVAETGEALELQRRREEQAHREWKGTWFSMDNESLSLQEIWNGSLLRRMRREMVDGGKSSRCRSMCRVVMGVEDRGLQQFQRSSSELPEAVVRNRQQLIEEINAGKNVLSSKPLELMVGVSANCNISCGFCDGPLGEFGDLSDRRRDEIIALLPTLMNFGVSGPGEPLMSRNYLAILAHISDTGYPGLSVSLTTNGTLLTPAFLERHRNVPWTNVRISLNSGSAETHERMTGKKLFNRVMTNLDALCAMRDSRPGTMTITLSCVLGSVQMGNLHKFAQIATDRQADVIVEPMYGDLRELSPWTRPERLVVLAEELKSVADDFILKNPPLSRAFRAVHAFALARLEGGETYALDHY